jgi:hypothetical protein
MYSGQTLVAGPDSGVNRPEPQCRRSFGFLRYYSLAARRVHWGASMLNWLNRRTAWAVGLIGWGVVCLSTGICCIPSGGDHSGPKRDPLGASPPALLP